MPNATDTDDRQGRSCSRLSAGMAFDAVPRRSALAVLGGLPLLLAGCGWRPLYAEPQAGPADARLRAIRVQPIPERIGQQLEIALRDALNPTGIPTPQRYVLHTTLSVQRADLGIQAQGLATRGRLDVFATYALFELNSGRQLTQGTVHSANAFNILAKIGRAH